MSEYLEKATRIKEKMRQKKIDEFVPVINLVDSFNGAVIEFRLNDPFQFDKWKVFVTIPGEEPKAPSDFHYLNYIKTLGEKYTNNMVYNDWHSFYEKTTKDIDKKVLQLIENISNKYGTDSFEVRLWFTVFYATMIAEENKEKAILKKRIKRLAVYQVLKESMPPMEAAKYSEDVSYYILDKEMIKRGI